MKAQLEFIGVLQVLLALMHVGFPRYFKWPQELRSLSLINRQMMYIHTLFIGLVVLLMGLLCLGCATELLETTLGRKLCLGLSGFWLARLLVQFFGYSPELWRGKRFESMVHVVFSCLWAYMAGLLGLAYWQ